jgi:hypothetical protein
VKKFRAQRDARSGRRISQREHLDARSDAGPPPAGQPMTLAPDSSGRVSITVSAPSASYPWWMSRPRVGDMFTLPLRGSEQASYLAVGEERLFDTHARAALVIAEFRLIVDASPVVYRFADPARGELRRPVASVPPISCAIRRRVGARARRSPDQPRVRGAPAIVNGRSEAGHLVAHGTEGAHGGQRDASCGARAVRPGDDDLSRARHAAGGRSSDPGRRDAVARSTTASAGARSSTGTSGRCATTPMRPCRWSRCRRRCRAIHGSRTCRA